MRIEETISQTCCMASSDCLLLFELIYEILWALLTWLLPPCRVKEVAEPLYESKALLYEIEARGLSVEVARAYCCDGFYSCDLDEAVSFLQQVDNNDLSHRFNTGPDSLLCMECKRDVQVHFIDADGSAVPRVAYQDPVLPFIPLPEDKPVCSFVRMLKLVLLTYPGHIAALACLIVFLPSITKGLCNRSNT